MKHNRWYGTMVNMDSIVKVKIKRYANMMDLIIKNVSNFFL